MLRPVMAALAHLAAMAALVFSGASALAAPRATLPPGDHEFTLVHDGQRRAYRVHVPARLDAARPAPLLVALHGGGGSMDWQADDERYGLVTLSEREGVVVVFPNGHSRRPAGALATWNAGLCCGAAVERDVDDVGFIRRVVHQVQARLSIDRRRVWATGMSNGAMMAYRLACEAADVFSAIAAVAGTDGTRACTPSRPVSVLHIHARDDTHVPYDGGFGADARRAAQVDFASVPDTVAKWARLDACTAAPRRMLEVPGAICERHAPCAGGARVQLCTTDDGGHSWPGGGPTRRGKAPPSRAISATEIMWSFFEGR